MHITHEVSPIHLLSAESGSKKKLVKYPYNYIHYVMSFFVVNKITWEVNNAGNKSNLMRRKTHLFRTETEAKKNI